MSAAKTIASGGGRLEDEAVHVSPMPIRHISMAAAQKRFRSDSGSSAFQPSVMSWS